MDNKANMPEHEVARHNHSGDITGHGSHDGHHKITIIVNSNPIKIEKGEYLVSQLKELVGVPVDYELDQVVENIFTPLDDAAVIHIKDKDVFVSHVRTGGSS